MNQVLQHFNHEPAAFPYPEGFPTLANCTKATDQHPMEHRTPPNTATEMFMVTSTVNPTATPMATPTDTPTDSVNEIHGRKISHQKRRKLGRKNRVTAHQSPATQEPMSASNQSARASHQTGASVQNGSNSTPLQRAQTAMAAMKRRAPILLTPLRKNQVNPHIIPWR